MQKKKNRLERAKTSGEGWFNMKAPEMTDEVKQNLEVLQMRGAIDKNRGVQEERHADAAQVLLDGYGGGARDRLLQLEDPQEAAQEDTGGGADGRRRGQEAAEETGNQTGCEETAQGAEPVH